MQGRRGGRRRVRRQAAVKRAREVDLFGGGEAGSFAESHPQGQAVGGEGRSRKESKEGEAAELKGWDSQGLSRGDDPECRLAGAFGVDREGVGRGGAIGDLHGDLIHDLAVGHGDKRRTGLAQKRDLGHLALGAGQEGEEGRENHHQDQRVDQGSGPEKDLGSVVEFVLRRVADQADRLFDLGHDRIASVDALGAVDTLHLQAIADIDPCGAGGDTGAAVDAVAKIGVCAVFARAFAARFTALGVVADDQGVAIQKNGLKTTVRAGDQTGLLAEVGKIKEDQGRRRQHHQEGRRVEGWRLVYPEPQGLGTHKV